MKSEDPLLSLRHVTKTYAAPNSAQYLSILEDVSIDVANGDSVAVTGPSGSGKSTLLHVMGTLDRPSQGEVELNGRNLLNVPDTELAWVRNRELGFVFQFHYLLPHCTVLENVLVPTLARVRPPVSGRGAGSAAGLKTEDAEARGRRLLQRVGLGDRLDHRPGQLSGGERQRVAVVRALINCPQLLLADEPTGSLDQQSAEALGRLLSELNREERVALVLITHSRDLARLMKRVFRLKAGHLEQVPE